MVLKSLGKKFKSVVKPKSKKEDTAPTQPPLVGTPEGGVGDNALPLHSWKGAKPGKSGETGPKIGKSREEDKPSTSPKWVKGGKSDKSDKGPTVIGGGRDKSDKGKAPVSKWKPGSKESAPDKGPVVIGTKRGDKTKGEDAPKNEVKNPYVTTPKGKEEEAKSPYLTNGANHYSSQTGGNDSHYRNSNDISQVSESYSRSSSDDYSSSADELSSEGAQVAIGEKQPHRRFKSKGTSAFEQSDVVPKKEGEEAPKGETEAKELVPEGQSDSGPGLGEVPGELALAPLTDLNQGDNDTGQQGGYTTQQGGGYTTLQTPEGQAPNKYLEQGDGGTNYTTQKGGGYTTLQTPEGQAPNKYLEQGEGGGGYTIQQGGGGYTTQQGGGGYTTQQGGGGYTTQQGGGGYTTQQGGGYNTLRSPEEGPTKYLTQGGGSNYSNTNYSMGGDRQLSGQDNDYDQLSISTSESSDELSPDVSLSQEAGVAPGAIQQPDVQNKVEENKDEKIAKMQQDLRKNTRQNKDSDERVFGKNVKVTRTDLSHNERTSKGWGMLPMRDMYRNKRQYDGAIAQGSDRALLKNGKATQYFIKRGEELEYEARKVMASNLKEGRGTKRDDTVIRFVGGKWLHADNKVADTTDVKALDYSINALREKLKDRVTDLQYSGLEKKLGKLQEQLTGLNGGHDKQQETMRKAGIAGRYIFVMNAAGELFAGKSITGVVHHSSFLAGGAVACAGEVAISGGQMSAISNTSGHYRPGPVYLWQAVKQLEMLGVPLSSLRVDVMGVNKSFKNAAEFLGAMDPTSDPSLFDGGLAIKHLNAYFEKKSLNKVKEDDTIKKSEELSDDGKVDGLK